MNLEELEVLHDSLEDSPTADAVATLLSIANTLQELAVLSPDSDIQEVPRALDEAVNLSSASIVFLSSLGIDSPKLLRTMASAFKKHTKDEEVGTTVTRSFLQLADKVEQVTIINDAKKKLVTQTS